MPGCLPCSATGVQYHVFYECCLSAEVNCLLAGVICEKQWGGMMMLGALGQ